MNQKAKEIVEQAWRDYGVAFSSEQGKRVLEDLMRQCYMDTLTYVPGDMQGSAFNEGKRFIGLHIKRILEYKPQ